MDHYYIISQGGESAALARLKYYLWDSDLVSAYFETRNGMLGGDYSTKLAPWLAAGCISPRTVYHQVCYPCQKSEIHAGFEQSEWRDRLIFML